MKEGETKATRVHPYQLSCLIHFYAPYAIHSLILWLSHHPIYNRASRGRLTLSARSALVTPQAGLHPQLTHIRPRPQLLHFRRTVNSALIMMPPAIHTLSSHASHSHYNCESLSLPWASVPNVDMLNAISCSRGHYYGQGRLRATATRTENMHGERAW